MLGIALYLLKNLVITRSLNYSQLIECVQICIYCCANITDKRVVLNALSLLGIVYNISISKFSDSSNSNGVDDNIDEDILDPILLSTNEMHQLSNLIQTSIKSPAMLAIISELLSYTSPEVNHVIKLDNEEKPDDHSKGIELNSFVMIFFEIGIIHQTRADPSFWVIGCEYGVRLAGLLDGMLNLLSILASQMHESSFWNLPIATLIAEKVCRQIQCGVKN